MPKSEYEPTLEVRRKAEAAGIDLDALKRNDPTTYAMLNAQRTVQVSPQLKEEVGQVIFATFPDHQVFELPVEQSAYTVSLLIFPPLNRIEIENLDEVLAKSAAQTPLAAQHAFYRVVSDTAGEHREFGLPISPGEWRGQAGVMVGPFADEAAVKVWGDAHVSPPSGLISDVLPYNGAWFCDLFRGDTFS